MPSAFNTTISEDQIYILIAREAEVLCEEARFGVGVSLEKPRALDIMSRAAEIHRLAVLLSK